MFHVEQNILDQLNVSRGTLDRLCLYQNLLEKWQKSINIVSRGTIKDFWNRHVLDSLQIAKYINGEKVLDVGSGGGFPGMVLAICTDLHVTCLDSDNRKTLFLEEVARQTKTEVRILNMRIESLEEKDFDVVCARGFAKLSKLAQLTLIYSQKSRGVFLKGETVEEEVKEASQDFNFKYVLHESLSDERGKIIELSDIVKRV